MSDAINRRAFLGRAAAAGAAIGGLRTLAAEKSASQPAEAERREWRNKQPTMAYAQLGRTNFMTSRIVFGAGSMKRPDGPRLLEIAFERGVNYIDTGRAYRNSEETLADFIKRRRDKIWIVSKAGHIGWPDMTLKPGEDAKAAKMYSEQLDESLKALRTDTIDCYMIQGVQDGWVVTLDTVYEAFMKARKAGKVRFFGLSTHTNVPEVCELAARSGRYDAIMLTVNPNSLADLSPRIKAMRAAGIGLVSMKTSGPVGKDPKVYDSHYEQMFAGQKLSPYQRAYVYLLARGGIDAFISHTPNSTILEENLSAAALKLPQAALDDVERWALAEAGGSCRHCGACSRACRNGVRPADLLRCHSYLHHYREPEMAREAYAALAGAPAARCEACGDCQAVCPVGIELPAIVAGVREALA